MTETQNDISQQLRQVKARLGIVGNTPALVEAVQRALKVAPIALSVLVTGESGSGKEFFPQIIHLYSPRKHAKYIAVNCGAIPEGTIDSELFGHEKGSFTGAVASRRGYFEEADGGTIFLDEVAELPLTTQARLLRVLETGEFIKVGSSQVQHTNIRVVAATNVDMVKAVAEGRFREDLYYRLSTVQITVPPLRERGRDILLLAQRFTSDFSERYRMPEITFSESARALLLSYRWPGNVRQLKNVVEQVALFEAGEEVNAQVLSRYLPDDAPAASDIGVMTPARQTSRYDTEREMLFNLIFRLQKEISALKAQVESLRAGSTPADMPLHITTAAITPAPEEEPKRRNLPSVIEVSSLEDMTLAETEKETIRRALDRNDGRRKETARELNISERTLYRKIKEYGLE